jgi:hypothetical protein
MTILNGLSVSSGETEFKNGITSMHTYTVISRKAGSYWLSLIQQKRRTAT